MSFFHNIVPFPYGSREGELVIRLAGAADITIEALEATVETYYRRGPRREIWLDAAELVGPGHAIAMMLRSHSNIVMTAPAGATSWPRAPGRMVVDVSEYLRGDHGDRPGWLDEVSTQVLRSPQANEIYAVDPVAEMLDPDALHQLDQLTSTEQGGTLYVAPHLFDRAVVASARAQARPWLIRRLAALPGAPAPASSPAA